MWMLYEHNATRCIPCYSFLTYSSSDVILQQNKLFLYNMHTVCSAIDIDIDIDIFVNCDWFATQWQ